jgi:hypothetical protein
MSRASVAGLLIGSLALIGLGGGAWAEEESDDERVSHERSHDGCRFVFGRFESESVPPPACTSPVGICTSGRLTGSLRGPYGLVVEALVPNNDPRVPFVTFMTGTSIVRPTRGPHFIGVDTGSLNVSPPGVVGSGAVSTLLTINEGGSGYLWIRGTLDFVTGRAKGFYSGQYCSE